MFEHDLFLNLSLVWTLVAIILLSFSWRLACYGKQQRHRKVMIFLTLAGWVFIAIYLWQSRQPRPLLVIKEEYIPWLIMHGVVGLVALLGATVLVLARLWQTKYPENNLHLNRHHKLYGRIFIILWLFTHIGGAINYVLFI